MKNINAYLCSDGLVYTNEKKAIDHEDDLLGQEIDGLLKLYGLDITRNQEYKGCLFVMKKREQLKIAVISILKILNHEDNEE